MIAQRSRWWPQVERRDTCKRTESIKFAPQRRSICGKPVGEKTVG